MKGRENDIARLYLDRRRALLDEPSMKLSDLLAARAHLAILEKTSNTNVRKNTQSKLNKFIIGRVRISCSVNFFLNKSKHIIE